jgi:hypothetical protein
VSETNTQGQSPLNKGTDLDHVEPAAPNLNVDPDMSRDGGPQSEEADGDADHTKQEDHAALSEEGTASGGAPEL